MKSQSNKRLASSINFSRSLFICNYALCAVKTKSRGRKRPLKHAGETASVCIIQQLWASSAHSNVCISMRTMSKIKKKPRRAACWIFPWAIATKISRPLAISLCASLISARRSLLNLYRQLFGNCLAVQVGRIIAIWTQWIIECVYIRTSICLFYDSIM